MSFLIPNKKYIKGGDVEATDILIKLIVIANVMIVGSALYFTFIV